MGRGDTTGAGAASTEGGGMTYTRRMEAALFAAELAAWNAAQERARWWYRTHPIMSFHGGCALCGGKSK